MKLKIKIIQFIIILFCLSCFNKISYLDKYKRQEIYLTEQYKTDKSIEEKLYRNNLINIKNGFPFYIIRLEAPLIMKKPKDETEVPSNYLTLKYGDIVFPVNEENPTEFYFYVKTLNNQYGWIYSGYGISINYKEDLNLFFFNDDYYIKRYKDQNGKIDSSNKIILAKNIVPMLLGNFTTTGWFYPEDYNLALEISKLSVSLVDTDKKTQIYAVNVIYPWNYNEILITQNLLADSYQKLKLFNKAEEIHTYLIKTQFWRSYDNCPLVGGLNSIVKLEMIYLEQLKNEKRDNITYKEIEEKIIKNIILVGDQYNVFPALDTKWENLTFAEWLIDILRRSLSREDFYVFTNKLIARTTLDGFADMINVYVAIEKYKEGKKEEALNFLTNYKPKKNFQSRLRINDWLSTNKIIPDSIIYQYERF